MQNLFQKWSANFSGLRSKVVQSLLQLKNNIQVAFELNLSTFQNHFNAAFGNNASTHFLPTSMRQSLFGPTLGIFYLLRAVTSFKCKITRVQFLQLWQEKPVLDTENFETVTFNGYFGSWKTCLSQDSNPRPSDQVLFCCRPSHSYGSWPLCLNPLGPNWLPVFGQTLAVASKLIWPWPGLSWSLFIQLNRRPMASLPTVLMRQSLCLKNI